MNTVCWGGRVTQLSALPSLLACNTRPRWLRCRPHVLLRSGMSAISNAAAAVAVAGSHVQAQAGDSQAQQPASDPAEFGSMVERLKAWKERYYDCIVPRKVGPTAAPAWRCR